MLPFHLRTGLNAHGHILKSQHIVALQGKYNRAQAFSECVPSGHFVLRRRVRVELLERVAAQRTPDIYPVSFPAPVARHVRNG